MEKDNNIKYIPELDGIRGIAIILVLVWHYGNNQVTYELNAFTKYFRIASSMFWSGVDLFFVLSGFLIGRILLANRNKRNYFKAFYIRRAFRILPLYFLIVFSFIILHIVGLANYFPWLMKDPLPFWSYLLLVQNILMSHHHTFGPSWLGITWSLAIEEQFYMILPCVIFFLNNARLVLFLVTAILVAFMYRIFNPGLASHVSLIGRMDTLAFGVLLSYIIGNDVFCSILSKRKNIIYGVFTLLLFGFILFSIIDYDNYKSYVYSWLAVLYALFILIPLIDPKSFISSLLRNKLLKQIGILSFGIYLYHQLITGLLHQIILNQLPKISTINDLLVTMLSLIVTLLIAYFSYTYFERPLILIGKKYNYSG